ncbi:MAG TPA: RNA methyltransferase [Bryobacteraceae bacterium]|nr:RNA methyltransferase [Bryobacteraceae bacterium]
MARVQRLSSPSNGLVREVRRAIARGGLTAGGCLVAETPHLLEEALRSQCEIELVMAAESALDEVERLLKPRPQVRRFVAPDSLMERLSATETSQGVICLVRPRAWTLCELLAGRPLVVALDGVQDPGNAGAIIRAAEAFGASGVLLLKGSVSPYNPKALRASAGSAFRVPLLHGLESAAVRDAAHEGDLALYAASASGGVAAGEADFGGGCVIVIGNEGRGLRPGDWPEARPVHIPTSSVESLNAAMAAGILLYEARRRREARP